MGKPILQHRKWRVMMATDRARDLFDRYSGKVNDRELSGWPPRTCEMIVHLLDPVDRRLCAVLVGYNIIRDSRGNPLEFPPSIAAVDVRPLIEEIRPLVIGLELDESHPEGYTSFSLDDREDRN